MRIILKTFFLGMILMSSQLTKAQETEEESTELAASKPSIALARPEYVDQVYEDKCWAAALESWLVACGRARIKRDDLCVLFAAYTTGNQKCYLQTNKIFQVAASSKVKMSLEELSVPDSEEDVDSWICENLSKGPIYAAIMDRGQDIGHCMVIYQIGYVNKKRAVTYMDPAREQKYVTTYMKDFVAGIKSLRLGSPL